ncbi:hypothetical protein ACHAPT_010478 [Fusarium lateritium]
MFTTSYGNYAKPTVNTDVINPPTWVGHVMDARVQATFKPPPFCLVSRRRLETITHLNVGDPIMDQEAASSGIKFASLANLPIEILEPILMSLPKQDVKSVRLTSRLLADKATPTVFNRIQISALKADRDTFFKIADSPHLACHVCTIVWEELSGDHTRFETQVWDIPGPHPTFPSDEWPFLDDILAQMPPLFWLAMRGRFSHCQEAVDEFLPRFLAAVDGMPNLHTFVSEPMHNERQLQAESSGYPVIVRVIRRLIQIDDSKCVYNLGFIAALVPALSFLATRPEKRVTRLLFADESTSTSSALAYLTSRDAVAFSKLEHLDLCISGTQPPKSTMAGFIDCLRAATNVSYLHLCREDAYKEEENSPRLLQMLPTLPRLTEVHLDDVALGQQTDGFLSFDDIFDDDNSSLVNFVRRHAKTLRKLRITTSKVTRRMLLSLSKLNSLQLGRFIIVAGEDVEDEDPWPTSEQAILSFVNKAADGTERPSLMPGPRDEDAVCTHRAVWAIDEWPTAAVFDTRRRGWRARGYEPRQVMALDDEANERRDEDGFTHELGLCRVHDPSTGLWVDRDGIWYDPRTDEEIMKPKMRSYESEHESEFNSWAVKNQRVWDWELGLWRDLDSITTSALHKFAVDRIDLCEETAEKMDEDDLSSDDKDQDVDMRPSYEQEDDAHLMRQLASPRWDWGRDDGGRIWYWQVLGNKGFGYATEMWHFRHRNGEEAYGDDPLEFWADWKGGRAGDVAEATPFGWRFRFFARQKSRGGPGSDLPPREEIGQLYGEPVLWGEDYGQTVIQATRMPADFDLDDLSEWSFGI